MQNCRRVCKTGKWELLSPEDNVGKCLVFMKVFLQLVFGLLCPLLCTGKADYHGGGFPRSRDSTMTRNWFLVVFRHKFLLLCDHSTRWGSLLFILESHPLSFDKGGLNSVERAGQSRPAQMCHIKFLFPNLFRIAPKITLSRCNCCF